MTDNRTDYRIKIGRKILIERQSLCSENAEGLANQGSGDDDLQKVLKDTRVRIGTMLKMDNVSFLIGAGASLDAGGVLLGRIPKDLEFQLISEVSSRKTDEKLPDWFFLFYETLFFLLNREFDETLLIDNEFFYHDQNEKGIEINLESYLSHLHMWLASLQGTTHHLSLTKTDCPRTLELSRSVLQTLIKKVTSGLVELLDLPKVEKMSNQKDPLLPHRSFIKKILNRPLNLRRVNLFTLNYDTLLEQGADAEGAVLVDGFVGNLRRVFRPESFNLDFYFPAQTTEGKVHRYDRALHLYKLHGSLNWHKTGAGWDNPYGLYSSFYCQKCPDDDVMIYPTPLKYGQALGLPYSELFRKFGNAVVQSQSVLFVTGYGFGDEHVNAIIRQALAIPSFTLIVIDPDPSSDFFEQLKGLDDERVWLITGWKLGTFSSFVSQLLPDLCEEEIDSKVIRTVQALSNSAKSNEPSGGCVDGK